MSKTNSLCFKCRHSIQEELIDGRVPFRAVCPNCKIDIHSCENCKNYKIGLPNDCKVPFTEYVRDRSKSNLCEDFVLNTEEAGFDKEKAKSRFENLFKD